MINSRSKFDEHLKEMDDEFIRLVNEGKFTYNVDNAVIFNTHTGREASHIIALRISGKVHNLNCTRARQLLKGDLLPGEVKDRRRHF
jgi:hypothetical protein